MTRRISKRSTAADDHRGRSVAGASHVEHRGPGARRPRDGGADRTWSAPRSCCGTSKGSRSTRSAARSGLKANAAKHSIFRAVRKMRLALEPFVEG